MPSNVGLPVHFRQYQTPSPPGGASRRTEPSSKITARGSRLKEEPFILLWAHLHRHLAAKRIFGAAMKFINFAVGSHHSLTV